MWSQVLFPMLEIPYNKSSSTTTRCLLYGSQLQTCPYRYVPTLFPVRALYGPWSSSSTSLLENAIKPLISTALNKRLENVLFDCMIVSHPRLRFCPGPNCQKVIFSIQTPAAKRVQVKSNSFEIFLDFRPTRQFSFLFLASDNKD